MDEGAIDITEVLILAMLALLFGGVWHWTGWLGWPTEPTRRPLGRMQKYDAPLAVLVYLASSIGAAVVLALYLKVWDVWEHGMPTTAPSTAPSAATAPSGNTLSIYEIFALHLMSSLPVVVYFLARCFPRADEKDRQTGFELKALGRNAAIGVVAGITLLPFILLLNVGCIEVGLRLFDVPRPTDGHELLKLLRMDPSAMNYAVIGVMVVMVAPVVEEILFRGFLLGSLRELGRGPAVFISAFLFALVHVGTVPWQALPALAFLGVALGILFERTGVLWPGIFAHATFNACNLALGFWESSHGS